MPTGVFIRTAEYRAKMSKAMILRGSLGPMSPETKIKVGNAQRGRKMSEENRKKQSERMKGVAFFKGHKHKPESIEKIKESGSGDKHYNWKGGITKVRTKSEYTLMLKRKKNGFTEELFKSRLDEQGGKCAICLNSLFSEKVTMAADHCHETMQPRGILCRKCNCMLGLAHDKIETLQSAIDYLKKWGKE